MVNTNEVRNRNILLRKFEIFIFTKTYDLVAGH